jgi:poly(A)-specific ribonuclease
VRATKAEMSDAVAEERRIKYEEVEAATGFTRVVEAMRDSGHPGVGHNCMFDIAYTLAAFAEPQLPPTWVQYKELVSRWFPSGLYDTKHLARTVLGPRVIGEDTSLGNLYRLVTQGACVCVCVCMCMCVCVLHTVA